MTAKQIFKDCLLFKTMGELNKAIIHDKKRVIKENWGSEYVLVSRENSILICEPDGGRMFNRRLDSPLFTGRFILKSDIISAINTVMAEFEGEGIPAFDLCTDSQLYWSKNFREKVTGVEAEPTGIYFGITILSYKP